MANANLKRKKKSHETNARFQTPPGSRNCPRSPPRPRTRTHDVHTSLIRTSGRSLALSRLSEPPRHTLPYSHISCVSLRLHDGTLIITTIGRPIMESWERSFFWRIHVAASCYRSVTSLVGSWGKAACGVRRRLWRGFYQGQSLHGDKQLYTAFKIHTNTKTDRQAQIDKYCTHTHTYPEPETDTDTNTPTHILTHTHTHKENNTTTPSTHKEYFTPWSMSEKVKKQVT